MNYIKAILLGIIQGITEWLPVSSTGHLLLFDTVFPLAIRAEFRSVFLVVIQLFSVFAVLSLYGKRLLPKRCEAPLEKKKRQGLYRNILLGSLPAFFLGFLLDDWLDRYLYRYSIICLSLIVYGILFLYIENKSKSDIYISAEDINGKTAFQIGLFQCLALIPGTSRSGATVFGARLSRVSRVGATEFSFLLSLPVMLGASSFRLLKFFLSGMFFTLEELLLLLIGGITAFLVSLVTVKFLLSFVKAHSFRIFGYYRIAAGCLLFFLLTQLL